MTQRAWPSTAADRVQSYVDAEQRALDAGTIAAGTRIDVDVVRTVLSKAVARGKIARTERGLYSALNCPGPARIVPSTSHKASQVAKTTLEPPGRIDPGVAQTVPEPVTEWVRRAEADVVRTSRELVGLAEMITDYERLLKETRESRKWKALDHHAAVIDLRSATREQSRGQR